MARAKRAAKVSRTSGNAGHKYAEVLINGERYAVGNHATRPFDYGSNGRNVTVRRISISDGCPWVEFSDNTVITQTAGGAIACLVPKEDTKETPEP